jgi:hypothetical protein
MSVESFRATLVLAAKNSLDYKGLSENPISRSTALAEFRVLCPERNPRPRIQTLGILKFKRRQPTMSAVKQTAPPKLRPERYKARI